jgi:hypothetical protein
MEPINRFALIVRPKRRYMEWANALDMDGPRLTADELPSLTEVYLLDATDSEADREELIDTYAEEIWEQQLEGWSTDEATWPVNRTPHTLRDWFDLTFVDMVFDADPDVDLHELGLLDPEAELRVCQWCHEEVPPQQPIYAFSLALRTEAPRDAIDQRLVPLLIGGSVRFAVRAQPGSEAAASGHDLILGCCSESCVNELRAAFDRDRSAGGHH